MKKSHLKSIITTERFESSNHCVIEQDYVVLQMEFFKANINERSDKVMIEYISKEDFKDVALTELKYI